MTRMETAAWPLACGGACVFAIAVVLSGAPSTTAMVVLVLAVAAWSLRAPVITGVLLGGVAWLFLTGFDVDGDGALRFEGWHAVARLAVLIAAGLAGSMADRWLSAAAAERRMVDGLPEPPEAYGPLGVSEPSEVSDDRYGPPAAAGHAAPRSRGARVPGVSTKESRDG